MAVPARSTDSPVGRSTLRGQRRITVVVLSTPLKEACSTIVA
ncbi:MAG TPA: hypothetical protein VNF07_12880 [Acidimicrobiales bacterium]|nr:hypothetical protein [Acidimicrobiales bacterium]